MSRSRILRVVPALLLLLSAGCAANFSNRGWEREIERQTGSRPKASFEFELEGTAMDLTRSLVSRVAGKAVGFGGIERIDAAVYALPEGKRIDMSGVSTRGWNTLVRTRTSNGDLMVLVRSKKDSFADLVVVAQGEGQLLYGRLKGSLDKSIPEELKDVLEKGGFSGLKKRLMSVAGEDEPSPGSSQPPPSGSRKP